MYNNSGGSLGTGVVNQNESSGEQSEDSLINNTRRQFVAGSAGAIGGLAVGSGLSGSVLAQEGEDEEEVDDEEEEEEEETVEDDFEDDVAILNYALTLEYLEARFYEQGLENISEEEFCNCRALSEESDLRDRVYDELMTIQEHEESHIETLTSTIEDLGGTPIEEPEFDFGLAVEYPMAFLGTAAQLEEIGVSAYAGAAPSIENEDIVPPALGIHSVEARHAGFLQTLLGETSFPAVIDEARSRDEVLELAGAFIVGEDGEAEDLTEDDTDDEEAEDDMDDEEAEDDMDDENGADEEAEDDVDDEEAEDDVDDENGIDDENGAEEPTGNGNETNDS